MTYDELSEDIKKLCYEWSIDPDAAVSIYEKGMLDALRDELTRWQKENEVFRKILWNNRETQKQTILGQEKLVAEIHRLKDKDAGLQKITNEQRFQAAIAIAQGYAANPDPQLIKAPPEAVAEWSLNTVDAIFKALMSEEKK